MDHRVLHEKMLQAFQEIELRFIHKDTGLLLNYAGLDGEVILPTEDEILQGKPNHLSWNCPIEDGAYYSGLYLGALVNLFEHGGVNSKPAAKRIAAGLLSLSNTGGPEGFIARNYIGNNKVHYAAGSNDQTFPWFYGLWRYCRSSLPSAYEKKICILTMDRVARSLDKIQYKIPCDPISFGFRGNYLSKAIRDVAKLLFIQRAMFDLTHDPFWLERYYQSLYSSPDGCTKTRLEIIQDGSGFSLYDGKSVFYCIENGEASENVFGSKVSLMTMPLFTWSMIDIALRSLTEMESDKKVLSIMTECLQKDAEICSTHIIRYKGFDIENAPAFNGNWRTMNSIWKKQYSISETHELAWQQMPIWFRTCPRFPYENAYVREPLFAGYIASLGLLKDNNSLIDVLYPMLTYYPLSKLNTSTFYVALCIYGQLLADNVIK